jgi:hypothetical protein
MSQVQKIGQGVAVVALTSLLFSGCSQVVKTGANVALGFSEKHIVPPILAMEDAEMVCNSGNALTPAIMSTKEVGELICSVGLHLGFDQSIHIRLTITLWLGWLCP